jgi:hypothetical protein
MPMKICSGTDQKITATGVSQQTTAFTNRAIRISVLTANVRIAIGPAGQPGPVATANSYLVKASDISLDIGVNPGDKLAVIQDTAGGVINIVEITP